MQPDGNSETLLQVTGLTAGYGQIQVLWGIDLYVHERESIVLLGANGAGKTTLLKTLMGLIDARDGQIDFDGVNITRLRTDYRVRRGIVYMSEASGFVGLTVDENILIGAQFLPRHQIRRRAEELYGVFPALAERRRALVSSLSGGQRKMVGIAKALAGNPQLIVMDEPSAGLSPLFVKEVVRVLTQFRAKDFALLIAEQNIKFLDLADRVYTLDNGRIGFSGTVSEIRENDALRRAYFGLK